MVAMPTPWKHPKTGTYYFRRAVPADLRDKLGWEMKVSLDTKSPAEAKRLFVAELEKSEQMIELARSGYALSEKAARALAGEWLATALKEDERRRDHGDVPEETIEGGGESEAAPYDWTLYEMEQAEEKGDLAAVVGDDVLGLIRDKALPIAEGSESHRKLVYEVFWAKVAYFGILKRRAIGDWSRVKELDDYPVFTPPPVTPVTGKTVKASGTGERLSDLFEAWKAERKPSVKTEAEFNRGVRRFIELHGDGPAITITKPMIRAFKDSLWKVPSTLSGDLRQMTLPQLLETFKDSPAENPLSAGSINKHLAAVSAVLAWAERNGYFDADPSWSNPALGVKVEDRHGGEESRLPYDQDDLARIFRFPIFTERERPAGGAGDAARWLPLLALFTGARVEELGQLLVKDVGQDGEFWFIDINTRDEGKKVKNRTSRRKVPLHPELLRCGFLRFVEERRRQSGRRLFPDLKADKHGQLSGNWSRWWGRYARRHGITDSRKVFHSFRHTFKTACRAAGLGKEIHDALTGHKSGDVGDAYGEGYPVSVLGPMLAKISYPGLDLSHLHAAGKAGN